MDVTLDGKVILVTGATGALGSACVRAFRAEGAQVIAAFHQNTDEAQELAHAGAQPWQVDIGSAQEVDELVDSALKTYGRVDALVHAAGNASDAPLYKMTGEAWDRVMRVHLTGAFLLSKALLPSMVKRRAGKILFVSSQAGLHGIAGAANYAAAKGGLIALAKSLAQEVGRAQIQVNAVCPGFFSSGLTDHLSEEIHERQKARSVLGTHADPQEIADFITYLLSDRTARVSGQVFHWDSRVF